MSNKGKNKANFSISGAGVLSAKSSELFKSDQGKRQLEALKKIHEDRTSGITTSQKIAASN